MSAFGVRADIEAFRNQAFSEPLIIRIQRYGNPPISNRWSEGVFGTPEFDEPDTASEILWNKAMEDLQLLAA